MDRRRLLGCVSGISVTALSGCLASIPTVETVTPTEKRVTGYVKANGTLPYKTTTILERRYWTEASGPEYRQDDDSPLEKPAVDEPFFLDDETYASLERRYDRLDIHVHVCAEGLHRAGEYGCTGPKIDRSDFNAFTLEDAVLIRLPGNGDRASVYRVYEGEAERDG